ncbi:MAG: hypothetical protein ABI423_04545, partial [Burkholderiales bacterium]
MTRLSCVAFAGLFVAFLAACGGGGGDQAGANAPPANSSAVSAAASLDLFAGDMAEPGSVGGTGAAARFNFPYGVAT